MIWLQASIVCLWSDNSGSRKRSGVGRNQASVAMQLLFLTSREPISKVKEATIRDTTFVVLWYNALISLCDGP
jgi:hypothetical protein